MIRKLRSLPWFWFYFEVLFSIAYFFYVEVMYHIQTLCLCYHSKYVEKLKVQITILPVTLSIK